jgi:hypothetical protein
MRLRSLSLILAAGLGIGCSSEFQPCWADIDGDGQKDLLVGQFGGGMIRVYKNLGEGNLATAQWLLTDGAPAEVPGVWCCTSSTPQFVDIDGDGRGDILSGSYSRSEQPMAGLFQVLYGNSDGTFRRAEVLKGTDGEPLTIRQKGPEPNENTCTRPFAVDWDLDGHLDLVVGNFAGTFYIFKGQGKGKFPPESAQIKAYGQPLRIDGYHSDPFVVDWDGDGDLDLLSGSYYGGVEWAENSAGTGKPPQLRPFRPLIGRGIQIEKGQIVRDADLKGPLGSTRIWVDDVNSDGKLDILVGDMVPLVSPADKVTEGEFNRRLADWSKSLTEASQEWVSARNDPKKQEEASQRYQTLYAQRREFMKEVRAGFVWLYLRK